MSDFRARYHAHVGRLAILEAPFLAPRLFAPSRPVPRARKRAW
jgi:hypothetical protein